MSEIQQLLNTTITTNANKTTPILTAELEGLDLPQNYSILINKLERLALGLDAAFNNLSLDRKEFEIAVTGSNIGNNGNTVTHTVGLIPEDFMLNAGPITSGRIPPPYVPQHPRHGPFASVNGGEVEYSRVVSDIWIGVILTLLIVSVIFFICSCFLYHKFQQWKNSYRTNPNEPVEICRRYPVDLEAESLPSYTIVSGLPTYDDALEEFRKAGIVLTPPMPMIKLFDAGDSEMKDSIFDGNAINTNNNGDGDNISISSTCTCGGGGNAASATNNSTPLSTTTTLPSNSNSSLSANALLAAAAAHVAASQQQPQQVIELNPEQLAQLSKKRLSLQIAFNSPLPARRGSRPRIDLYREVNRNNLLRSRALGGGAPSSPDAMFAPIHRSSSSLSLSSNVNERNFLERRFNHLQHRGSLC